MATSNKLHPISKFSSLLNIHEHTTIQPALPSLISFRAGHGDGRYRISVSSGMAWLMVCCHAVSFVQTIPTVLNTCGRRTCNATFKPTVDRAVRDILAILSHQQSMGSTSLLRQVDRHRGHRTEHHLEYILGVRGNLVAGPRWRLRCYPKYQVPFPKSLYSCIPNHMARTTASVLGFANKPTASQRKASYALPFPQSDKVIFLLQLPPRRLLFHTSS
jgi:hypothetical protein